jgi:hypothetical protein|tara:strand:+ start:476 stop:787 length:312 start_codon:yes stop_codon:yes gene_type:complete
LDNLGVENNTLTLGEIALKAGYSESMAKNPQLIMNSETVKEGIASYVKTVDDKRRMAIRHITERKLQKAPAKECAYVTDVLTKQHQLLSGGATENVFQITWEK